MAFEKILFPIVSYSPTSGVFGSRWITEVSVLNAGAQSLTISGAFPCFSCFTIPKLPPGATYRVAASGNAFLLVEKGHATDIRAAVRIYDVSREAVSAGAQVPTARESEFSADRLDLLGIPADPRFRRTLRIYGLEPVAGDVLIRVYSEAGGILSGVPLPPVEDTFTGEVTAHLSAPDDRFAWWETRPAYAELGDRDLPPFTGRTTRLEILPLSAGTRIWAFVSLTNNETQAVTIIAPY